MFGKSGNTNLIALDNVSSSVMIADNNGTITYMNTSLRKFFESKQDEIKKALPNFSMETLIGTNVDDFHKNPAHQRSMIAALRDKHEAYIKVAGESFDLLAQPLIGLDGKRHGTMVEWRDASQRLAAHDYEDQVKAINRSQACIRFTPEGEIIVANPNFLEAVGYEKSEIVGGHHRIFVDPQYAESAEYEKFWRALGAGEFQAGEFKRINKHGEVIWLQASYNPLFDQEGKVRGVIKFATDITAEKNNQERRATAQRKIADDLSSVAKNVSDANDEAKNASEQSQTASSNVQSVLAASEELTASVAEINRQLVEAKGISDQAVNHAEKATSIVSTMSEAAGEINNVVNLISDIAEQTNLLALNATIEAARAGEAGRGFGVVAAEVKDLAEQTAKATDEIANKIANVQKTSEDTAAAIGSITDIIQQINEISVAISSAVEEQSATTSDVTRNMQVAADGVATIDQSMAGVSQALEAIDASTNQVREASSALG